MALFVIAGKCNCPNYAKVELLADYLQLNLPKFKIRKVSFDDEKWESYLNELNEKNKWNHKWSPIIWRELVFSGGRPLLIGNANDFQEYIYAYYGCESELRSPEILQLARENNEEYHRDERRISEMKLENATDKYLNFCILSTTNTVNNFITAITLNLLTSNTFNVTNMKLTILLPFADSLDDEWGDFINEVQCNSSDYVFDRDQIVLGQGEIPEADILVICGKGLEEGNCSVELMLELMERIDMEVNKDCGIFISSSNSILINQMSLFSKKLNRLSVKQLMGISRHVENVTKMMIGKVMNCHSSQIANLIIWGDVHGEYLIDFYRARVIEYDQSAIWATNHQTAITYHLCEKSNDVIENNMINVKHRIKEISELPYEMFHASALMGTVKDWWNGNSNEIKSLIILSDGSFGITENIAVSLPVRFTVGCEWTVASDINISDDIRHMLNSLSKPNILSDTPTDS
ncbi:hypothetical protein SNEBB_007963 [Seison nebaliae]|nr:hypothetical protein SNEBB_007963 [Seison nebaliae]